MIDEIAFIKQKLLDEYKEVIDLIVVYGSYARGTYNEFSDVDMFVLVDAEKRYSGITSLPWIFRYKNIVIDCWESIWEQQENNLELIRNSFFLYPIAGLLDCDVLYYKDQETLTRFRKLQENVSSIINDDKENVELLVKQYKTGGVEGILRAQREGDLLSARMNIWGAVFHMITALARLNGSYYKQNWGRNLSEAYTLELLPKDFESRINFLIQTEDLSKAIEIILDLDVEIREMIKNKSLELLKPERGDDTIDDIYIGILEYLNKMRSSCKKRDFAALSYEATELQLMTAEHIAYLEGTIVRGTHYVSFTITGNDYLKQGLPDLSALISEGDFDGISEAIEVFEEKINIYMKDKASKQHISDFNELVKEIENKINSPKA
ncbi:MAG: nucleotidyltransferase domain-containing protein [Candidatus Heimdallarchaeota archaeon]|nr:nucleotidyltransferase domain-containing protein [Candidatus Heimdallarchaeota archaeon]